MVSATGQAVFAVIARDAASKVLGGIGKQFGKLQSAAGTAFKVISAGAIAAASAIAGIAIASIKGAMEDEKAQTRMVATLKARGLATTENLAAIDALILAGQKLGMTDDDVRSSIETATQYTKSFSNALKINKVAQDLAVAKGMDLADATAIVGKAFQGNGKALKALGINLQKSTQITKYKTVTDKEATKAAKAQIDAINKERKAHGLSKISYDEAIKKQVAYTATQKSTIKGQEALNLILQQYGGIAQEVSQTGAVKLEAAQIRLNEAFESFGAQFLPDVANAIDWFTTNVMPKLESALKDLGPVIKDVIGWFVNDFIPKAINKTKDQLGPLVDRLALVRSGMEKVGQQAKATFGPDFGKGFENGIGPAKGALDALKFALDVVIAGMRLVGLLPPAGLGGGNAGPMLPGAPGKGGVPKLQGPTLNVGGTPKPTTVTTNVIVSGKVLATTVNKTLGNSAVIAGTSRTQAR